jgi:methyl-accepting chemotaxis protein
MIFKKSITARFIVAVFAVLLAGQILGTVLFILNTRSSLFDSLEVRIQRISAFAAGVCAGPLLSYDYAQLDTYLEEIVKDVEITAVHILDKDGNLLREKTKTEKLSQESMNPVFIRKTLSMKTPVMSSGGKIGEVVVDYNADKINQNISRSMVVISVYQLVLLVCVGFVMMLLFRRNITSPVFSINKVIEKITLGDLSTPVPDLGENEIGEIAKGIAFLETRLSMIMRD